MGLAKMDCGTLDSTFKGPGGSGSGWSAKDIGGSGTFDVAWAVTLQSDGKILLAGQENTDAYVARLNTDGTLDSTFGSSGVRTIDYGGTDIGYAVTVDSSGRAVLAGSTTAGTGGDIILARLSTAGALDSTFNSTGKITTSLSSGADLARGVAIDNHGRIVVGVAAGNDFGAARYTPAGALDTSFNSTGKAVVDVSGVDTGAALALDQEGRILVAGSTDNGTNFGVVRLNTDGSLDTTFNGTGKQTVSFVGGSTTEKCKAMMIQADGKIVLAGQTSTSFAVARLSGGGARDYLLTDANYDVTATADATGKVLDRYQYDPYGTITTLNPDFSADPDDFGEVDKKRG